MKKILATILLLLTATGIAATNAYSQGQDRPTHIRTIEVIGMGEVSVVPNEVVMNLGVETTNMSLEQAKRENDARVQQLIKSLRDAGIAERDIQTANINIEPQYDYRADGRQFLGFMVRRNVTAKIKDVSKLEDVTSRVVSAGITSIFNYEYRTSDEKKLELDARAKAVASAKERAEALAKELGLRIVKAYSVIEEGYYGRPIPVYRGGAAMESSMSQNGQPGTFALGEITISSNVRVIFEVQ